MVAIYGKPASPGKPSLTRRYRALTKRRIDAHCLAYLRIKAVIAFVVLAALLGGVLVILKHRSRLPVTVILRIAVTPAEQAGFVMGRASSAQFKYLMGKQSGVKPVLAQKLAVAAVPRSSLLEARIGVETKDEAQRYAEVFIRTLQDLCGGQAQLTLADQSIR